MRVIHKQAVQAHLVPSIVMEARGPFSSYEPLRDETGTDAPEFPSGATAQNEMNEVVLYQCRDCGAVVKDRDIDYHECEV